MRLDLFGGFAEKGRTCVGVRSGAYRVLLDVGIKTSARGRSDYHPAISPPELARTDAIVITHAHEDHAGALGWCLANGFAGRILMTPATRAGCDEIVAAYGGPGDALRLRAAGIETLAIGEAAAVLGPLRLATGRSGHIPGGVWCVVDDGTTRAGYCGDVASASPVFAMDPMPACDALVLDASYADDDMSFAARAAQVVAWVEAHPQGSILPTPRFGRSLELLAILPEGIALAPGMRDALASQIQAAPWLAQGVAGALSQRLARARDHVMDSALPAAPLVCHDGMGMSGPSRDLLERASRTGHPVLFTGHVPDDSPGARVLALGNAHWIRLPTHPTRGENVAMAAACNARLVLGHSCPADGVARLAGYVPGLRRDAATGDSFEL